MGWWGDDANLSNSRACTAMMLVIISVTAPRITCNCLQKGFQLVFSKTAFSETVFSQSEDGQKGVWGCRPYSGPTDLMQKGTSGCNHFMKHLEHKVPIKVLNLSHKWWQDITSTFLPTQLRGPRPARLTWTPWRTPTDKSGLTFLRF